MSVIKAKDFMNTRYLINALVSDFDSLIDKAKNENLTIDMCDCRVGPLVANAMKNNYANVDFINTEDSKLNELLKSNCEISRIEYPEYETFDVGNIDTVEDLVAFITRTDIPNKVTFDNSICNSNKKMAAVALLIMSRPEIEVDTIGFAVSLFNFVRSFWLLNPKDHESYFKVVDGSIITVNKCKLEDIVLPSDFGSKKLFSLDGSVVVDDEWEDVISGLLKIFKNTEIKRRKRTIKDFVTVREV